MSVVEIEPQPKPRLALLEGGKVGNNWLWKLPIGTAFLVKEAGTIDFRLTFFQLVEKSRASVHLMLPNYSGGPAGHIWVDPVKFSNDTECIEILVLGIEDDDGTGDTPE